jgi:hypothetical protein
MMQVLGRALSVLRWWRHQQGAASAAVMPLYRFCTAYILPLRCVVLQVPGRALSVLRWWRHLQVAGSAASSWLEGRHTATQCTMGRIGEAVVAVISWLLSI